MDLDTLFYLSLVFVPLFIRGFVSPPALCRCTKPDSCAHNNTSS